MVLMFVWDAYGDRIVQNVTVVGGKWLEENVLRTFVDVFLVLVMGASWGVVCCGTMEGVGVGRASVEMLAVKW